MRCIANLIPSILMSIAIGLLAGACALQPRPAAIDPLQWNKIDAPDEQKALLDKVAAINRGLDQFKGKGKLYVYERGKLNIAERLFWVCAEPDKMRLALVASSGLPLASFASDGEWFYIRSHTDGYYSRKPLSSANLDAVISIPVSATDIIYILSGRVALAQHPVATFYRDRSMSGYMVVYESSPKKTMARVYLDQQARRLVKIEWMAPSGSVQYEVTFGNYRIIEGYQVPYEIVVQNVAKYRAQLSVLSFWPHPPVDDAVFTLHRSVE